MLTILVVSSLAWVDQALAVAGQIAFNDLGPGYSKQIINAFSVASDNFSRPAEAVAWSRYVDRPPFNIASFNHWHFRPNPYNLTANFKTHYNEEDLATILNVNSSSSLISNLKRHHYSRPWPFAFAAKIVLGAIPDSYAPLHLTELFDSDNFPDGDYSGRKFRVLFNGQYTTLFDAWESGCGFFSDNLTWSDSDWDTIDQLAKTFAGHYPKPDSPYDPFAVQNASHIFDTTVTYYDIVDGEPLPSDYVKNCTGETQKRVALAGWAISSVFKFIEIPEAGQNAPKQITPTAPAPVRTSEAIAWALFAILATTAAFLVSKKHCGHP
jgi:hypothetical protein